MEERKPSVNSKAKGKEWRWVDESEDLVAKITDDSASISLFDFVAETGLSRPHEKRSRKTIRAHASRHSRQRKGKENDATKNWANHMAELPDSKSVMFFNPVNAHLELDSFDPFNSFPGGANPQANVLVPYWDNEVVHSRTSFRHMQEWLPFAISSPPFFYGTLFLAAIRMSMDVKTPAMQVTILRYKGETIRAIKECLKDNEKDVESTTICAVSCLVQGEGILASNSTALAHLKGLETLVNRRGGLPNLGMNGLARAYILWADLCASMNLNQSPTFQCECMACGKTHQKVYPHGSSLVPTTESAKAELKLEARSRLKGEATDLQSTFQKISSMLDEETSGGTKVDQMVFSEYIGCADRRAILILRIVETIGKSYDATHLAVFHVFAFASSLFSYLILRQLPQHLSMERVARQMIAEMKKDETRFALEQRLDMLLWIISLGGLSATDDEEQLWYEGHARQVCGTLRLFNESDVSRALQEFGWPKASKPPKYITFWENVFSKTGSPAKRAGSGDELA